MKDETLSIPEVPPFQGLAPMTSYAQNFEDVMLRRALPDVSQGFYVDVGAYHPVNNSVTKWFYDQGWSGINVEPVASLLAEFVAQRPRDINLQLAVGATHGRGTMSIVEGTGLSSVTESELRSAERADGTVEIVPLDDLLTTHATNRRIDFLKIDIEGAEAAVINTSRFETRPRIIVVEATAPNSQNGVWDEWEPHLLRQGFSFVWFDGLNRFYLADEERWRAEFFAVPPNVFDNFKTIAFGSNLELEHVEQYRNSLLEQLENASVHLRELEENRDGILVQLKEVSAHIVEVERERVGLRSELEDASREIRAAKESAEALAARLEQVTAALQHEIKDLEGRLGRIVNSTTWRLTRPLRAAADLLRSGRS